MTVHPDDGDRIVLEGECPSEDAEILLQRLLAAPHASVDLQHCDSLHAAIIQVLLVAQRKLQLPPAASAVGKWMRETLSSVATADLR